MLSEEGGDNALLVGLRPANVNVAGSGKIILSGGEADGTVVSSGGLAVVSSGGVASGTTISSGGTLELFGGATLSGDRKSVV